MLIINKIENFSYYGRLNYKYYYNSYSVINRRISYAIYRESADNNLCNRTSSPKNESFFFIVLPIMLSLSLHLSLVLVGKNVRLQI